jgi:NADH-quinone oxidoreductase E subunit
MQHPKLTDKLKTAIEALYPLYETRMSAIMPALTLIQDTYGYVPQHLVEELAHFMDLPLVSVEEVLTFYSMYHRKPTGKYHFQFCTNLTCCMFQARETMEKLKARMGVSKPLEVSGDSLFSFEEVPCLGSCGTAPVLMINQDYQENAKPETLESLIDDIRSREA